jgi:hypothetical protein
MSSTGIHKALFQLIVHETIDVNMCLLTTLAYRLMTKDYYS